MLTAKQAKDKSDTVIDTLSKDELSKIERRINEAINKGEYSINWPSIRPKNKLYLESLGYKISTSTDIRDGWSEIYIIWK